MTREYGEAGERVAAQVLQGRIPQSLFDFPLSEELIRAARQVVVHSDFAAEQVRGMVPQATVSVVPMGIRLPPLIDRDEARLLLDLPKNVFILSSITAVNPYKRLDVVLRALSRVRKRSPIFMLIAGNVSSHVPLERWIGVYGLDGAVELLGFVDDRSARLIAAASDALVNLRYPTAGETSASLLRLMASGRPVLVSSAGSFTELPDGAVSKVPVDVLEEDTLEAMLEAFIADPALARDLGANGRRFVEERHTINHMAVAYHRVLKESVDHLPVPPVVDVVESIDLHLPETARGDDIVTDQIARAMVELGLGSDLNVSEAVAQAMVDLGLGPDKM